MERHLSCCQVVIGVQRKRCVDITLFLLFVVLVTLCSTMKEMRTRQEAFFTEVVSFDRTDPSLSMVDLYTSKTSPRTTDRDRDSACVSKRTQRTTSCCLNQVKFGSYLTLIVTSAAAHYTPLSTEINFSD